MCCRVSGPQIIGQRIYSTVRCGDKLEVMQMEAEIICDMWGISLKNALSDRREWDQTYLFPKVISVYFLYAPSEFFKYSLKIVKF